MTFRQLLILRVRLNEHLNAPSNNVTIHLLETDADGHLDNGQRTNKALKPLNRKFMSHKNIGMHILVHFFSFMKENVGKISNGVLIFNRGKYTNMVCIVILQFRSEKRIRRFRPFVQNEDGSCDCLASN